MKILNVNLANKVEKASRAREKNKTREIICFSETSSDFLRQYCILRNSLFAESLLQKGYWKIKEAMKQNQSL